MKLSRAPIGRTGRLTCNGLESDAATVDAVLNGMAVVVMRVQEREIQTASQSRSGDTMNFHLFDLAGFIGVLLIVVAYLLLQLDKLPSSSPRYSLLNAGGALLIIVSLIFAFNLSAFIVEAFWFLISLLGLWRSLITRKHSKPGQQWPQ